MKNQPTRSSDIDKLRHIARGCVDVHDLLESSAHEPVAVKASRKFLMDIRGLLFDLADKFDAAAPASAQVPVPVGFIGADSLENLRSDDFGAQAESHVPLWHAGNPPSRAQVPVYLTAPAAPVPKGWDKIEADELNQTVLDALSNKSERDMTDPKPQDQRDIEAREALKPCPFCHDSAYPENSNPYSMRGYWVVICSNCEAEGPTEHNELDAIGAWKARPAPEALPSAAKRLIGWRTSDYLMETSDPEMAKNWQMHLDVLPIFEGEANTKLAAPEALGAAKGELSEAEITALWFDYINEQGDARQKLISFARAILAKAKDQS